MMDFNETNGSQPTEYDLDELSRRLADTALQWIPDYFPRGIISKRGDEMRLANIRGAPPRHEGSCVIKLKGDDAGSHYDHSTGKGGKPLSTLAEATGLHGADLFARAAEIVGTSAPKPTNNYRPRRTEEDTAREIVFILQHCVNTSGTPVDTYMASRDLANPDCFDLLFHPNLTDWNEKIGRPAMVAVIRHSATGEMTGGIHRTYLSDDGTKKADMPKAKMMLGPSAGIVALMSIGDDGMLGLGEGIETSLAGAKIFGIPVWAALSAGNMRNFQFPPGLKRLIILADTGNDGELSARALHDRATASGIYAEVRRPRGDDDFAKDLVEGLWDQDMAQRRFGNEMPGSITIVPATASEILPPPKPSVDDLIARARSATSDSPELHAIMRAAVGLDQISKGRVLKELKKASKIPLSDLNSIFKMYQKEAYQKARDLVMPAGWVGKMELFESGEPKPILINVTTALREDEAWRGVFGFNEFSEEACVLRPTPFDDFPLHGGSFPKPWTDIDDLRLTEWLQRRGLHVGREIVTQAVPVVAKDYPFHPVREWLESLEYDGVPRLDYWLQGYVGAADTAYTRAVGSRFMLSAVARVYHPGCKAECVLILEGNQGAGKSSILTNLFEPWFTDEIAELGNKDSAMQLLGVWGIELAELDAMDRSDIRRLKAFISRTHDRYRPPYGEHVKKVPRQCVFCGSINPDHSGYLRDPTGGRRFWPIQCTAIDLEGFREIRIQLWAEAYNRYHDGEKWYLFEQELIAAAGEEQADRYQGDAWSEKIDAWLEARFPPTVWRNQPIQVRIGELLEHAVGLEAGKWGMVEQKRVAAYLRQNEWERIKIRNHDGSRQWVFRKG